MNADATTTTARVSRFARLGAWCCDRRGVVLGLWVGALVLIGAVSGAVGMANRQDFGLPNVESKAGFDVLTKRFGGQGTK